MVWVHVSMGIKLHQTNVACNKHIMNTHVEPNYVFLSYLQGLGYM